MDTLLVIDDAPDNLEMLFHFLSLQGFKVLVAKNGEEGIETAACERPDLILLDVMMPGIDGFEVCKILKCQEEMKDIPIIFMTARNETIEKVKGFQLGAADYLTKPLSYEELLARVTAHLNVHKLQRQLSQQNQLLIEENQQRQQAELEREQALRDLQAEKTLLAERVEERTTELRVANTELARALRLKDEFLANMSHELRTPLTAILGISETLQDPAYGTLNDKQRKKLNTIEKSGHNLLTLINDLLDFTKIEAGKLTLAIGTVSINEVCQASLHITVDKADKKQIQVSTAEENAVETVQADKLRLKQILVNLLSNAIKFTPEGGAIELEVIADTENGRVNFSVQDTGIGIAQEDLKYLFDPFVQVDGGLNRVYEGTGLGLSLAHRLTKMHGGQISVKSEVGKGSRFTVSLPWQS
ncbi:MAG: hybrid sensor histidine kinase/response regulator [Candidatus Parabeggiatoa sp. nov. 1]|nr:MAG: hybrid sensor histidine kinase/response regulator [Gammaproteobacteria bacterium]HEC85160.1 hybrid sensor histidine kinase/response regulator [Thioploca sp.]